MLHMQPSGLQLQLSRKHTSQWSETV